MATIDRPFDFDRRYPLNLESAVYQAVGAASMCWENVRAAGVFDSEMAQEIAEALLAEIRRHPE